MKKKLLITLVSLVLAVGLCTVAMFFLLPQYHYSRALSLIEEKNYNEAYSHLKKCEDFKDSKDLLENFVTIYDAYTVTNGAGEIQSKKEYTYDENDNLTLEQSFGKGGAAGARTEYAYDENGNEILLIAYNKNGEVMSKVEREYDEYGNVTLSNGFKTIDHVVTNSTSKHEYEYDSNGNVLQETTYDEKDRFKSRYRCEYDENNNKTLVIYYDEEGEAESRTVYDYNEDGNVTLEIHYNKNDAVTTSHEWEYDAKGNPTLYVGYDKNGKITSKTEYTYTEDGWESFSITYADAPQYDDLTFECKFDKNGNVILSISRNDGNLMDHSEYEYDEYGNMTRWTGYDEKGNATYEERTEYEYDEYGNMTLKIEYDNDGNVKAKTEYTNPRFTYRPQEEE